MSKKRAARRQAERDHAKLARDVERLAKLEPGGAPDRPLSIVSPSEVEVHVASAKCPLCGGELKLDDHAAETIDGRRLRVARTRCAVCRAPRSLYFELRSASLN